MNRCIFPLVLMVAVGIGFIASNVQYDKQSLGNITSTAIQVNRGRQSYPATGYSHLDNGKSISYYLTDEETNRCANAGVDHVIRKGTPVVMYKTLFSTWFEFNGVAHEKPMS